MQKIDIINDEFLTIEQVTQMYGLTRISQQKLRTQKSQLSDKPHLKYYKIGRKILYKTSDIKEFIETCVVGASK
ncbi:MULTISPECIES: helix-turn-helix domain-containing protein [unclassified Campylobacter]|uniref:helix-turn-helix domain-containing protein n=1 Tax=unclassified Campylobacter TaxID=2593542 RepID=UPI0022E9B1BC|nr:MULTISPECIES: helix-turn-helix domain-containing protein [unclassified Campylobacter]MDA3047298.1 helix-turn-helix domain-containing protein [Campylobacter sp. JMF_08 NE1]MDA3054948.1 helix-turn-helix domain-containing protein [Campylobacter sp. VBCF_07 NA4]MDA3060450.1 helix-turn-helix domain-containing protein [Campylobacter sp. VBCF_02 NA5]MDA3070284.1 helix-turn-helix domain-containing protein [Campylobacter sp. VBCF_08 NA3]WBR54714.1 helix-turn-helix domain-containing protein [Campylob